MTVRRAWYAAGRDWPAIDTGIPAGDILAALEGITDAAVAASAVIPLGSRDGGVQGAADDSVQQQ